MFTKKRADKFYKRRGQREMLMILDGKLNEAVETSRGYIKKYPDDLESMFVLTVALTQQGKVNEAYAEMLNTIKAGMSFSRFLSGPRNLLKPLYESNKFKSYYRKHPVELLEGPMVGSVTGSSAKFWVRTAHQIPVTIYIYSERSSKNPIRKSTNSTKAIDDYTGVITVKNLRPNTKYYYNIFIKNKFFFNTQKPSFNTFSRRGSKVKFAIGFGGGAGYNPKNEYMWKTIKSFNLSAMLLLGDNVYIDVPGMPNAVHYYTYYRRESQPYFRNLVNQTPIFTIWDDHDAAFDDIWLGPYVNKPDWKQPMLKVFREQWVNPGYGTKKWPGVWYKFYNGDVEFFMLDCRTYRIDPFAPNPSMLGPVQKTWLLRELKKSNAVFKVLVSSVPWAFGAKPDSHDPWIGFPEEREEIFSFIANNKINGVVLVSADRHRSDAWIIDRKKGYNFYEFESSKLTNLHTHPIMPGSIFGYNKTDSFGIIDFDTKVKDPKVTYKIVSIDGEIMNSIMIRRSELEVK